MRNPTASAATERQTRQRTAIRNALAAAARPLTPPELLAAAQEEAPGVGIATVYRAIKALLAEGGLVQVALPGEPARYELARRRHHHHCRCRLCNRVFDMEGTHADVQSLAPPGFQVEGHDITLTGLCADCRGQG
ncbi:MAG: transcriptional repressor [Lentisphaeria bacterium]|jgi:Fur family ferric uptake transcriptional regulator